MGKLFDQIRKAVFDENYLVGAHAGERMDERGIADWQVVEGISHAKLLAEWPGDKPNPSVDLLQLLADGTEVKVVWAWLASSGVAKLVTVHYLDDKA